MDEQKQQNDDATTEDQEAASTRPERTAATPRTSPPLGLLSADDILGSTDLIYKDVPVPEWTPGWSPDVGAEFKPRKIRMRVMNGDEALEFAEAQADEVLSKTTLIRLVCTSAIDHNGDRLFTEEDMEALMKKSFVVYKRLQDVALVLNGFAKEEEALEEEKNG